MRIGPLSLLGSSEHLPPSARQVCADTSPLRPCTSQSPMIQVFSRNKGLAETDAPTNGLSLEEAGQLFVPPSAGPLPTPAAKVVIPASHPILTADSAPTVTVPTVPDAEFDAIAQAIELEPAEGPAGTDGPVVSLFSA